MYTKYPTNLTDPTKSSVSALLPETDISPVEGLGATGVEGIKGMRGFGNTSVGAINSVTSQDMAGVTSLLSMPMYTTGLTPQHKIDPITGRIIPQ